MARALANDPPVILADEPTGSLDSLATAQVCGILRDLVTLRTKTVVAVTHDLNLAIQMYRRIHVVHGKLAKHSVTVKDCSSTNTAVHGRLELPYFASLYWISFPPSARSAFSMTATSITS